MDPSPSDKLLKSMLPELYPLATLYGLPPELSLTVQELGVSFISKPRNGLRSEEKKQGIQTVVLIVEPLHQAWSLRSSLSSIDDHLRNAALGIVGIE